MTGPARGKPRSKSTTAADNEPEEALFQRTMAGVQPLKKKRSLKSKPPLRANAGVAKPKASPKTARGPGPQPSLPRVRTPEPAPLSADGFAGVDRRTIERMRRGKLPIDARLDLHGSYQDAAQAELNAFISSCAATGCRTVLVITGKGPVSEGGGVLRRRLPDWLNLPACRPHVLAFAAARPEHGGGGAFYVLLRRRRDARA
ncbi:MAG: DNA mismatch repair protein MutS [Alphaproteobacteria bacterium]|nr:DNA mismatch repair protein MutS [Alphaproteobacteria bacterium]